MDLVFESKDVRFQDDCISLFRNGFVYQQFYYHEVDEVKIYKGFLLKNNLIVITCSIAIMMFALNLLWMSYNGFQGNDLTMIEFLFAFNRGLLLSLFGPILLLLASTIAFVKSFVPSYIARIKVGHKIYRPRLKEIREIDKLEKLLKTKYLTIVG